MRGRRMTEAAAYLVDESPTRRARSGRKIVVGRDPCRRSRHL